MFNKTPKNWNSITLGELLDYERPDRYIVSSEDYSDNYKIPVLTAGKTFILGYTNEDVGIYTNLPVIIFDDFTTESKYVDFDFKVKSSAMKILKTENQTTLKYLYYLMQTIPFNHETHKRYWISEYSKLKINIPEKLEEQQEIVRVLDAMSNVIRLRKECIQHAQDLIPAIFQEMFGDPINNNNKYETYPIKSLGKVTTGATPSSAKENMFGGTIPFITPGDLETGNGLYHRYVTEDGAKNSRVVRKGSTMVCCIASIGKVDIAKEKAAFNQQINAIEWNNTLVNDIFALYLFRLLAPMIQSKASGPVVPILNKSNFENIFIPKPNLKLQEQFAQKAIEIENYIQEQQEELESAEQMFQSLLHLAFTGELTKHQFRGNAHA